MDEIKILEPRPGKRIAAIEVPGDAKDFIVFVNSDRYWLKYTTEYSKGLRHLCCIELPCKCEIISLSTELSEEQCAELVETSEYYDPHAQPYPIPCYKDYVKWQSTEALASFMSANGLVDRNPLPDPEDTMRQGDGYVYYGASDEEFAEYEEAQSLVKKYIILLIVE